MTTLAHAIRRGGGAAPLIPLNGNALLHLLAMDAGHGACGTPRYDHATRQVVCACGQALYRLEVRA